MSNEVNEKLKQLYSENWEVYNKKIKDWELQHLAKGVTNPLCLAVNENYLSADIKVMIFGQETNGWCDDDVRSGNIEGMQKAYLSFFKGNKFDSHKGQFKNGFNHIVKDLNEEYADKKIGFIWNNIIKRGKKNGKGKPPKGVYNIEKEYFNIISQEINILKPDVIIFLSGPYYDVNIKTVFKNVSFKDINEFKKRQLAIVDGINTKIAIRTYHPNYLYRVRGKKKHTDYFNTIMSLIKNAL